MVDSGHHAAYLSRVWIVFEQFVASKLGIPVTFMMPGEAVNLLKDRVEPGKAGIMDISRSRWPSQQACDERHVRLD